jgi:hypothetical protein
MLVAGVDGQDSPWAPLAPQTAHVWEVLALLLLQGMLKMLLL